MYIFLARRRATPPCQVKQGGAAAPPCQVKQGGAAAPPYQVKQGGAAAPPYQVKQGGAATPSDQGHGAWAGPMGTGIDGDLIPGQA
jgi:hypothetical protein